MLLLPVACSAVPEANSANPQSAQTAATSVGSSAQTNAKTTAGSVAATSVADDVAAVTQGFGECIAGITDKAHNAGISEARIAYLGKLKPVTRVIELDRSQPEFTQTFADYFNKRVTERRILEGQKLLKTHAALLDKIQKEYGVPAQYLLAFWGLETNFGSYKGKMPVLDSLATLACDKRRSQYFTQELLQALKLADKHDLPQSVMVGSWAGAMGHTQFMPTTYLDYAVDGDGDGRADLWGSTADALTSAANFLKSLGWQAEQRWGREVLLPANYDFTTLGRTNRRELGAWGELGVQLTNGQSLPAAPMSAALYLPAGHTGPAFLGYENFEVIQRWNRSEFYAIAVGHLADRIKGAPPLTVAPPLQPKRTRDGIKQMQSRLIELGFLTGDADGVVGSKTTAAVREFQRMNQLVPDGFADDATMKALGLDVAAISAN
ncbi:lytic murein transglycosylase [Shewanella sp. JM162201]|uniref:Lytic murein transglycosylase n=1 Tax=Shewanella jiangmenensis TaxID=2837387 RepID=A0ABS5V5W8_9GAMM|nr:lytic murein transglycosylase [Shewanella jiangmenensis]